MSVPSGNYGYCQIHNALFEVNGSCIWCNDAGLPSAPDIPHSAIITTSNTTILGASSPEPEEKRYEGLVDVYFENGPYRRINKAHSISIRNQGPVPLLYVESLDGFFVFKMEAVERIESTLEIEDN